MKLIIFAVFNFPLNSVFLPFLDSAQLAQICGCLFVLNVVPDIFQSSSTSTQKLIVPDLINT